MTSIKHQLLQIIRPLACGSSLPPGFSVDDPKELYLLAKRHDMAHFIGYALEKGQLAISDQKIRQACLQQYFQATFRVTVLENELAKVRDVFESSGIDFIPLKGAVIRKLYPAQWMRVSADIDILVRAEELEKAEQALVDQLNYTLADHWKHHDQVITPSGFHVEMHFTLTSDEGPEKAILDDAWNRCALVPGTDHEYRMDDEMFYLFHMAHAAKHFRGGGCGVRPVLDTWFLNHRVDYDPEKRKDLLRQAGLLAFAETMEKIAEAWFSGAKTEGISDVEDYILTGGVYGGEQRVAAGQARKNGRLTYLISRACPPIDTLKYKYPVLEKCPLLLPFCWIHRLINGLFKGKGQLAKYEFAKTKEEAEHSAEIAKMFKRLGLS